MRDAADDPLWYDRDEGEEPSSLGIRLVALALVASAALWSLPDRLTRSCGRLLRFQRA